MKFKPFIAEALGTFVLIFTGCGAMVIDSITAGGVTHVGVALTFGLVVMSLVYALGDVSGAHFNPAVTAGFVLAGRLSPRIMLPYFLSQFIGALLASLSLLLLFGNHASLGASLPAGSAAQSFGLEIILTAILMFIVLCVSTGPREMGTMAGIGVIALEALFAGPISGASMNPIRSLAPALVSGNLRALWVYLLAPMLGAAIAVPLWHSTRGDASPTANPQTEERLP